MCKTFDGSFYDADYFERGKKTGKGWLENYHWMPRRSFKEALAFIDLLGLDDNSYVLDYGCAKAFIVKALRELYIRADGCDISEYALSHAPYGCWDCTKDEEWKNHQESGYTHVICKDVFEHLNPEQLNTILIKLSKLAKKMACIVPLGDNGIYRIPEYHMEISHLIAENEQWWINSFSKAGWSLISNFYHVPGIKDNWFHYPNGNMMFVLEYSTKR